MKPLAARHPAQCSGRPLQRNGVVNAAVAERAVIVLRDQAINDEEQILFSRAFGPLELPPQTGLNRAFMRRLRPELYDVSNIDSQDLRDKAHDAVAEHYFWKTRGRAGFVVTDDMCRAMPPATHIVGWPRAEGERFLEQLNAFAAQPEFMYTHRWRPGDLVIWDNRCTLHRATPYDVFIFKRDLRRTTINEYGSETSSTAAATSPPSTNNG